MGVGFPEGARVDASYAGYTVHADQAGSGEGRGRGQRPCASGGLVDRLQRGGDEREAFGCRVDPDQVPWPEFAS